MTPYIPLRTSLPYSCTSLSVRGAADPLLSTSRWGAVDADAAATDRRRVEWEREAEGPLSYDVHSGWGKRATQKHMIAPMSCVRGIVT